MTEDFKLKAYCVKCKEKREMQDLTPVFTSRSQPAMRGTCPVCGTNMFRMGRTPLHEGMEPPPPPPPPPPTGKVVIVESPTKARTVGRFLGKDYTVKASVGHVRDLLRSKLSVDVENDFEPRYRVPNEKRDVVKELQAEVENAAEVYLATDPDREGEAIAWHLSEVLELTEEQLRRVVFHEITHDAVDEAFSHPRTIDMDRVDAQQARRILDRLVGYKLSPLLWRKVRSRLSAGRVQSVALRLIVEREREIEAFDPEEYWSIDAELKPQPSESEKEKTRSFIANLARIRGEDFELHSQEEVDPILDDLEKAMYIVSKLKKGKRRRNPSPPYTTSSMQQDAANKLHSTAKKTMRIAQQLYEGIDVGNGDPSGLITYMRTDSTNISEQAQQAAREYIQDRYGAKFLPEKPPVYKTRAKAAQEAHEAIRPTDVRNTPDKIKSYLSRDQRRLYELIWRRFVASQMLPAVYETRRAEILAGAEHEEEKPYLFRASGSILRFPGYLIVYGIAKDEDDEKSTSQVIPPLKVGAPVDLVRLLPEQHFTQPPPRYSDASLIRTMEEYGIGRPSTYAAILSTLFHRGYVTRERRSYEPTETGVLVNDLLVEHFPGLINVDFTADMEEQLDKVAEGEMAWVKVLREFYGPFADTLAKAEEAIPKIKQVEYVGRDCPKCGEALIIRWGRYGKFIGCSNFPDCRYTEPWLEKIGVKCPECEDGEIVVRKTRKRRTFYGCSTWPECEFTSWKRPMKRGCPACGGMLVEFRKETAKCLACDTLFPFDDLPSPEESEEQEEERPAVAAPVG